MNCKIERIYGSGTTKEVEFRFLGEALTFHIPSSVPLIKELYESRDYKKYYLQLIVRKGVWNSYIVEDWELLEGTPPSSPK